MDIGLIIACIIPSLLLIACSGLTLYAAGRTWGTVELKITRPVVPMSLDAVCVTAECTAMSKCFQCACMGAEPNTRSLNEQKDDHNNVCDENLGVFPFFQTVTRFVSLAA